MEYTIGYKSILKIHYNTTKILLNKGKHRDNKERRKGRKKDRKEEKKKRKEGRSEEERRKEKKQGN